MMSQFLPVLSSAVPGELGSIPGIFLMLVILVTAARIGGTLMRRIGQPSVLGELMAGMVVGPSLLALVNPADPFLHVIAEFGVVILLFQIGLHTDLGSLVKVGAAATSVGLVGVTLP